MQVCIVGYDKEDTPKGTVLCMRECTVGGTYNIYGALRNFEEIYNPTFCTFDSSCFLCEGTLTRLNVPADKKIDEGHEFRGGIGDSLICEHQGTK